MSLHLSELQPESLEADPKEDLLQPAAEDIVLMFAYHFPPENTVGADRPYRFYKYLPRFGQACHVITAADVRTRPELDADYLPDLFLTAPRQGLGWRAEVLLRKLLIPGGIGIRWAIQVQRLAKQFVSRHPNRRITVLSSHPPVGSHLAAFLLARSAKLPWIADFRDPLADNPVYEHLSRFHKDVLTKLEKFVLHRADAVIVNTDAVKAKLSAAYPQAAERISVIWNGFDPEQRLSPLPHYQDGRLTISHVGSLYGDRVITRLLESVQRLIDDGRLDPAAFRMQLIGTAVETCLPQPQFLESAQSQGWLKVINRQLPQADAREVIGRSHGLIIVLPKSKLQVPAKLFEYLQIGRPILAFIAPGGPVENIIKNSGVPHTFLYADQSQEAFDTALLEYFRGDFRTVQPSEYFETTFNGERHAATLAGIAKSLRRSASALPHQVSFEQK